jgi:hypothetical protein
VSIRRNLEVARAHQSHDVQVKQALVNWREGDTAAAERQLGIFPPISGENVIEIHFGDRHAGAGGAVDE